MAPSKAERLKNRRAGAIKLTQPWAVNAHAAARHRGNRPEHAASVGEGGRFLRRSARLRMVTDTRRLAGPTGTPKLRMRIETMVHRGKESVKRPPARASAKGSPAAKPESGKADVAKSDLTQRLEARTKALENERDLLKAELEAARERIASLEESRSVVANRIDGVIESLHGIVDGNE